MEENNIEKKIESLHLKRKTNCLLAGLLLVFFLAGVNLAYSLKLNIISYFNMQNYAVYTTNMGYLFWICFLMVVWLAYIYYKAFKISMKLTEIQTTQNKIELTMLMSELMEISKGNLTVIPNVRKGITKEIVSYVNSVRESFIKTISSIHKSSQEAFEVAKVARISAKRLVEASDNQAREFMGATAAVNAMAASIEHVSTNAAQSAEVAEKSVNIANNGVMVVQNTISGMERIREQIQETAKRIKRLGESSQEIGDTVSLIDDIADQTNILSLNAAIQAAMSGEAGRGFAVVADEVQRLAERSSRATKEIETLVKTIQSDTKQAVISMEQTTSEVVQGAHLAQDAGVALEKIVNVSRNLADLIQNISNAAQQQASTSGKISKTMGIIEGIATQTASGTVLTANSIGTLSELIEQLNTAVAIFKFPDQDSV